MKVANEVIGDGTWAVRVREDELVMLENISGKPVINVWLQDGGDHNGYKLHASWPSTPDALFVVRRSQEPRDGIQTPGKFVIEWGSRRNPHAVEVSF